MRGAEFVILLREGCADHQRVAHAALFPRPHGEIGLVVQQIIQLIAHQPARAAGVVSAGRVGGGDAGHTQRGLAIGEAVDALWRAGRGRLIDPLIPGEVADRDRIAEFVGKGGGQPVERELLAIEIDDAEIIGVVDARERPARDGVIRHPVDRRVVVRLVGPSTPILIDGATPQRS